MREGMYKLTELGEVKHFIPQMRQGGRGGVGEREKQQNYQVRMTDTSAADELPVKALITPAESKWSESCAKLKLS